MVVTAAFRPPHPSPQPGTASKGCPLDREGITRSSFIDPAIARKHSHCLWRAPPAGVGLGALVAVPIKREAHLIEYDHIAFQPELKEDKLFYVSMGSGQALADPFLAFVARVLWKNERPTVDKAKFGVYWALSHTIQHAPGSVGDPIHIAELRQVDGKWIAREIVDLQETNQYITDLEDHIAEFVLKPLAAEKVEKLPSPPPDPSKAK
jgi:hypothetical protein